MKVDLRLHRYEPAFTAAMAVGGILAAVSLLRLRSFRDTLGPAPGFDPLDVVAAALVLFIAAAGVAVALRAFGARAAWRVTGAACRVLLFWFPVGTGLFVWWVLAVREREEAPSPRPPAP